MNTRESAHGSRRRYVDVGERRKEGMNGGPRHLKAGKLPLPRDPDWSIHWLGANVSPLFLDFPRRQSSDNSRFNSIRSQWRTCCPRYRKSLLLLNTVLYSTSGEANLLSEYLIFLLGCYDPPEIRLSVETCCPYYSIS